MVTKATKRLVYGARKCREKRQCRTGAVGEACSRLLLMMTGQMSAAELDRKWRTPACWQHYLTVYRTTYMGLSLLQGGICSSECSLHMPSICPVVCKARAFFFLSFACCETVAGHDQAGIASKNKGSVFLRDAPHNKRIPQLRRAGTCHVLKANVRIAWTHLLSQGVSFYTLKRNLALAYRWLISRPAVVMGAITRCARLSFVIGLDWNALAAVYSNMVLQKRKEWCVIT